MAWVIRAKRYKHRSLNEIDKEGAVWGDDAWYVPDHNHPQRFHTKDEAMIAMVKLKFLPVSDFDCGIDLFIDEFK